jgi:hypothetical protein
MSKLWTLNAELRSGVLLLDENYELHLRGGPADTSECVFQFPEEVQNDVWVNWDRIIPSKLWDYKVTYVFPARDELEATEKAWSKLEHMASFLSFMSSAPVNIKSYGSVTDAPAEPIPGEQYTTVSLTFEQASEMGERPAIQTESLEFWIEVLMSDQVKTDGFERIARSMRWLQQSHFAKSPVDEFMGLLFAFEAVSHLLKPSGPFYWHCAACDQDVKFCPECGASTEWGGSGRIGMEWFVTEKLRWESKEWRAIWRLRNQVLHGRHDITQREQQSIVGSLARLEEAVVNALRFLLKVPSSAPPTALRQRGQVYGAKLHIKWTKN